MNILVLGGSGFVGSHLIDKLRSHGHRVRVFDKNDEYYRKPIPGIEYCHGDFENHGLVSDALRDIDWVFHLISTTLPKTSNDDFAFDVRSNVMESISLFEKCVAGGVKKVVFLSSGGTIYGNPRKLPVKEDSPQNPICSYGVTKLMIEKYLFLFNQLYGLKSVILRPSNVYGPRQNPNGIQGIIPVFLGKFRRGEPIEIWGDGKIVRDYIYVEDLVEGIYRAACVEASYATWNLGSGRGHSINEILRIIRRVVGCKIDVRYGEKRPFDVQRLYLDIDKAKKELSWKPETSLADGIKKTWEFIRAL